MKLGPVTLTDAPLVMGIVNVTPDSFSDGGRYLAVASAVAHAEKLVRDGAALLDIGGESTRPGALPVALGEELERVIPVIEGVLALRLEVAISVDTRKAEVAKAALEAGAHLVNDVSALADSEMAAAVAAYDAPIILMHMRGEPRTMQQGDLRYDDVVATVIGDLARARDAARVAGVTRILVDPGIGFGKTAEHNLILTKRLGELKPLGPVVYGASRKRFLGELTERDTGDRDRATAAINALAVMNGAAILRVHDVAACIDAVRVAAAVRDAKSS